MTDIGELVVRIKADAGQLQQELAKASASTKQTAGEMVGAFDVVKASLATLGVALSIGGLVEFGRSALESADHINDLALRTGFAGSTLSALNIPLKQSGSNLDEFSASMNRMNNLIGEAAKGTNQEAVKAFDALGLSVRKLQQLTPEQQFYAVAEALAAMDSQGQMTNAGMAIFGRSFAAIIPLIKESRGNLREFTEQAKAAGDALTDEQLKRIDAFGDKWTATIEKMKLAAVDLTLFTNDLLNDLTKLYDKSEKLGEEIGNWVRLKAGMGPKTEVTPEEVARTELGLAKAGATGTPTSRAAAEQLAPKPSNDNSARGSNADLLRSKDSELKTYLSSLKQETDALGLNQKALAISRAEIEGAARAKSDFDNHLRSSKALTDQEKQQIDSLAGSYYDLKKAQQEAEEQSRRMQEALSQGLADLVTDWKSAGASITSTLKSIANEIIKNNITSPLSKALVGDSGSGQKGLFSSLLSSFSFSDILPHFAQGGYTPGGPVVVGDGGEPEIFNPGVSGTITPFSKLGGTSVIVQQTINMSPGLPETVNAAIRNAAPQIAAASHASVMRSLQLGGPESQIIGKRAS